MALDKETKLLKAQIDLAQKRIVYLNNQIKATVPGTIRSGSIESASFNASESLYYYDVIFTDPFIDSDYAVNTTVVDLRSSISQLYSFNMIISNKTASGFRIYVDVNILGYNLKIDWTCTKIQTLNQVIVTPGTSGTSATSGTSGTASTSGTSGTSGTSATSGTSGTASTAGTSGTSGTASTSGTSGTSGTASTTGTSGTSSTAGTSGTSSTSGSSGTSGGIFSNYYIPAKNSIFS